MYSIDKIIQRILERQDSVDGKKIRNWYKKKYGVTIGRYTYGFLNNEIAAGTIIGSFCSIATGVKIGVMNHPTEYISTNPFLYYSSRGMVEKDRKIFQKSPVVIEDDVWIGANVVILPGVTVHRGAILAAGAVVNLDVEPYTIAGGVPAKAIKKRFSSEVVEELQKINWCTWSDEEIKKNIEYFYDPISFINKFRER